MRHSQNINISEAPPQGGECDTCDLTVSHSQPNGNNLLTSLITLGICVYRRNVQYALGILVNGDGDVEELSFQQEIVE